MAKSNSRLLLMISILSAVLACSSGDRGTGDGTPAEIDPVRASAMIASIEPPLILDVRTPGEYAEGHIPGARLVPLNLLADSLAALSLFKDREVIAVCRSGRRSGIAAGQLSEAGFDRVYNLKGGMIQWKQNGGNIE